MRAKSKLRRHHGSSKGRMQSAESLPDLPLRALTGKSQSTGGSVRVVPVPSDCLNVKDQSRPTNAEQQKYPETILRYCLGIQFIGFEGKSFFVTNEVCNKRDEMIRGFLRGQVTPSARARVL